MIEETHTNVEELLKAVEEFAIEADGEVLASDDPARQRIGFAVYGEKLEKAFYISTNNCRKTSSEEVFEKLRTVQGRIAVAKYLTRK